MQIVIDSKIKYCQKHKIDFINDDETAKYYDKKRPYSWYKILMIKEYLNNYDYVFWSDADVLIKNFDYDIRKYINDTNKEYNFIFSYCFNGINAGNFFVKNSKTSFESLDLIYSQTRFINNQWWEQMSILYLLDHNSHFKKITFIEKNNRFFNSYSQKLLVKEGSIVKPFCYDENDFLIHYCGLSTDVTSDLMKLDSEEK
jgi:mannan polymerase II complex MNN10 subunit